MMYHYLEIGQRWMSGMLAAAGWCVTAWACMAGCLRGGWLAGSWLAGTGRSGCHWLMRMAPVGPQLLLEFLVARAAAGAVSAWEPAAANVRDFGAHGDGRTDDLPALRRALANVSDIGGGIVYFPVGQYAIAGALRVTGYGISLRGAGSHPAAACQWGSALLSMTANSTMVVFDHCTSCSLSDLTLSHVDTPNSSATAAGRANCPDASALFARHEPRGPHGQSSARAQPYQYGHAKTMTPAVGAAVAIRNSFAILDVFGSCRT